MNFITNRGTTKLATTNKGSCGKVMSKLSNLDMMNSIRQFGLIFIFNEQFFNFFYDFFFLNFSMIILVQTNWKVKKLTQN